MSTFDVEQDTANFNVLWVGTVLKAEVDVTSLDLLKEVNNFGAEHKITFVDVVQDILALDAMCVKLEQTWDVINEIQFVDGEDIKALLDAIALAFDAPAEFFEAYEDLTSCVLVESLA